MSGERTNSDIWNHFIKNELGGVCEYWHLEVKTEGNTTNLLNHSVRRHPTIKNVSLEKSDSGGGNTGTGNAQNGDGNNQVSVTCI